ncbi:hypothetical protein AVEN_244714-1 [Araneus ventricosus]|uniref:Uncharacterized protein n=1 Tax=Araneus ventricosus TaxID=182803 RepID=A0A4Y2BTF2_ARAVE|nr:hypothetical protein AVEN_244714-1 [Araneus ventricosus]
MISVTFEPVSTFCETSAGECLTQLYLMESRKHDESSGLDPPPLQVHPAAGTSSSGHHGLMRTSEPPSTSKLLRKNSWRAFDPDRFNGGSQILDSGTVNCIQLPSLPHQATFVSSQT